MEHVETESPTDPANRMMGLVVVAVLTLIVALVIIVMAFSTTNTPMSVDGDRAERSQWFNSGK